MLALSLAVGVVIVTSALCSLAEAVLYSVPASHIESLAEDGQPTGQLLRRLREKVDAPITAILSLNTLSNTAGATVAGALAAKALEPEQLPYFTLIFTLSILLLSEVMPKTTGVIYSRPLASYIARPLAGLVVIFRPIIWLCGLATKAVSRGRKTEEFSEEELLVLARQGFREGALQRAEADVIHNILALPEKNAREVMTPRTVVFSLHGELSVAEALEKEGTFAHSRIPIYFKDMEDVSGLVHRPDLLRALRQDPGEATLRDLMKPIDFVLETTSLDQLLRDFLEKGQHLFAVLDEFGGLSGIVTLEDVLEEILGQEIIDEFDQVIDMRKLAQIRREKILQGHSGAEGNGEPRGG